MKNIRFAEEIAQPVSGEMGVEFPRQNDFREVFYVRWGRISFDVLWGLEINLKVILKVYREGGVCENFIAGTDPSRIQWNRHRRTSRDFFIHPFPKKLGRVTCVKFSYVIHAQERSIPSEFEYIFMDGGEFDIPEPRQRPVTRQWATPNTHITRETDPGFLQRDADHYNRDTGSLRLTPKFTKGETHHPYHPKRFIHDHIDKIVWLKKENPAKRQSIKVAVDCIDDTDFVNHLIHARYHGVDVQCIVDWRKMTLTNSDNYIRLKLSGVELFGVFCTLKHPLIEVAPDMHTKFVIFGEEDAILGSFNITFDRWGANWESGMTFHSFGVCRLLDNIFESLRGGHIQRYGIDPMSPFNLLYTFGRHYSMGGKHFRPHHAIFSEIRRARHSIKLCLFLMGELRGEYGESVVDALGDAWKRGVDVKIILNGHLARAGDPGKPHPMKEELHRPLLPAVAQLKAAGIPVALAYGVYDQPVPYSPLHAKYCVIDEHTVIEGSFNWYNTSVFSHDLLVVAQGHDVARPYLHEFQQILDGFRTYY